MRDDEKIIIENINLIYFVLKKLGLYYKHEELFDVGMIGLTKGVKTFNPDLGYKLATYLVVTIKNEIMQYMRKKQVQCISLDNVICEDKQGNELTLHDIVPNQINIEEDLIMREDIKLMYEGISKLDDREKFIICSMYGLNNYEILTQREIAKKLNCSQAQVSRIKTKTIKKLKVFLK